MITPGDELVELMRVAFNMSSGALAERAAWMPVEKMRCVLEGDRIVAAAAARDSRQWRGGRELEMSAIWGVQSVDPRRSWWFGDGTGAEFDEQRRDLLSRGKIRRALLFRDIGQSRRCVDARPVLVEVFDEADRLQSTTLVPPKPPGHRRSSGFEVQPGRQEHGFREIPLDLSNQHYVSTCRPASWHGGAPL